MNDKEILDNDGIITNSLGSNIPLEIYMIKWLLILLKNSSKENDEYHVKWSFNLDDLTRKNIKKHNANWSESPNHPYGILVLVALDQ